MKWRILDGPHLKESATEDTLWVAVVENENDRAQRWMISAVFSDSALASEPASLPRDVVDAIASNGRTAIEKFLDEQQPPDRIYVSSLGISTQI